MESQLSRERASGNEPDTHSHDGSSDRLDGVGEAPPKLVSSRSRCPYCHEEVRAERADWVACEGCLARHHSSCWSERGSCATCHSRGALARRGKWRARGVAGIALLVLAAAAGGFVSARGTQQQPARVADAVTVTNARDEALLALGFFTQTRNNELFVNRMVAAANRYNAQGKSADANLLREVARLTIEKNVEAGFEALRDGGAIEPQKTGDALAKVQVQERKIAYEVLGTDPKKSDLTRASYMSQAKQLLDVAAEYARIGATRDASRIQEAADALVSGQRKSALALLGLPDEARARKLEKAAYRTTAEICATLKEPGAKDLGVPAKEFLEAATIYEKLGCDLDAKRARAASDACATGAGSAALKLFDEDEEK